MKKLLLIAIALVTVLFTQAQVITADPPFPTANGQVVITFDATQGSGGLAGYSGTVYAHTGVITNQSTSGSDWKYVKADWGVNIPDCKMVKIGNDLWQLTISPSIRDYYGVPANETIEKMAFVFRSESQVNGQWLEGKTETGGDIFYDVSTSGLNVQFTLPAQFPLIVEENDIINIAGNSSDADSTLLFVDNVKVYSTTSNSFSYTLTATGGGTHWVKAEAVNSTASVADSFYYYVRRPVTVAERPDGVVDGINYINASTVILSLYAPDKNYVFAIGDFNDWQVNDEGYMNQTPDGKHFWIQISNLIPKKEYIFQYFIDGQIRIGDPYADKVSDPWNDQYISNETYPNLIQYPTGKTSGIATVLQTDQDPYPWQNTGFIPPATQHLNVYELLVRDFIEKHDFSTLKDTLDYLQRLGINAIELMPVSEFEGNLSWGYNPNYYFAPDKYYGPKNTFKAFVDECHSRNIAVIMDMVLNHAYNTNPMAMEYWDAENNRPAANNPWFNTTSPNPDYSWGNDFNHESPQTQAFVDTVNRYWMREYHIDGFRFDFTKGFTNTPGDGSGYDQSRINILERMASKIWEDKPNAMVILEHFTANSEEKILSNYGMMLWGNSNYNYNEATMGYFDNNKSDFSWISYKKRGWSQPNVMGYMESHDEERLMFKNITYGNGNGSYQIKQLPTALKRMELAGAFFFTIPGPKMIWQFGERGFDYSINWPCMDGSCRTDPKPSRWDYMDDPNRKRLYFTWKALIDLKDTLSLFETSNYDMSVSTPQKRIRLTSPSLSMVIIGNFDVKEGSINPDFYSTGKWYDYFTGSEIDVTNVSSPITLQAGEFKIYTNKKLNTPDYLSVNENSNKFETLKVTVFPNPAVNQATINVSMANKQQVSIELLNLQGKQIENIFSGKQNQGIHSFILDANNLTKGIYLIVVKGEKGQTVSKLIVQ